MEKQRHSPWVRLLPSLTDVAFLMPILFLFVKLDGAKTLLGDGDTGWHIRTGEWILENGRVPDKDIFSYTKAGQPWFAWEWLWDVAFGWMHQCWGMEAVVLGSLLVLCVTFALVYRLCLKKCGNPLLSIAVTFLAAAVSSIHWLARPHLFTLLFVVVFYWILESASEEDRWKRLWVLPALTVLWTNLHGGFFVGVAMIATYAAGELISAAVTASAEERARRLARSRPFLAAAGLCAAASLVNPYTYKLHVHVARYLTESYHFENISEFLSVNFHHPGARYFELLLALGVIAGLRSVMTGRLAHALLAAGWAHLALVSSRNIPIFAIVTAPLAGQAASYLLANLCTDRIALWLKRCAESFSGLCAEVAEIERFRRVYPAAALSIVAVAVLLHAPNPPSSLKAEYDPEKYPARALASLPESESLYTTDEWGDYLIYRLYPGGRVFIDGRSDFYGPEFGKKYLQVARCEHTWQKVLDSYGVRTILLPVKMELASVLKESSRWRVTYDDGVAIVFRRPGGVPAPVEISAVQDGGVVRDRSITENINGDKGITTNARRERP